MLKKALKKLSKITTRKKEKAEKPTHSKEAPPSARLLTAEGWKRLMMKKYRS
jgi:hypothetical protein